MKKFLLISFFTFFLIPSLFSYNAQIGDTVCVQGDYYLWYQGKVVDTIDNTSIIKVEYSSYDPESWDEFDEDMYKKYMDNMSVDTESSEFRLPYTPKIGEEVLVETGVRYFFTYFHTAKVIAEASNNLFKRYLVKYNEYKNSEDNDTEIVYACRIFKIFKKGDYAWGKWKNSQFDEYLYAKILDREGYDNWKAIVAGYAGYGNDKWYTKEKTLPPNLIRPAINKDKEEIAYHFQIHEPIDLPKEKKIFTVPIERYGYLHNDSNLPEDARPFGVGDAAKGGKNFFINLKWPQFKSNVDVYLVISYQSLNSEPIYLSVWQDKSIHPISEGLKPFKKDTSENWGSLFYVYPLDFTKFPDGKYTFYLVVTPPDSFDSYYAWKSDLKKNWPGTYSNKIHNCTTDLTEKIDNILNKLENNDKNFYKQLKNKVEEYKPSTNDDSKIEAYNIIMFTSYFKNNLETFCWAALNAYKYAIQENSKSYESVANSAIVCLNELGELDLSGEILDCAIDKNNDYGITHQNAAFYYKLKNDYTNALNEKIESVKLMPTNYHNAWDGGFFVENHSKFSDISDLSNLFYNYVAKNYPLLSKSGERGKGLIQYTVCCNCNKKSYPNDVMKCLSECKVTLACFTHICTPYAQCCGGDVFDLQIEFCFPPAGLQACVGLDENGDLTLSGGGSLFGFVSAKGGVKLNFSKGSYSVYVQGQAGSQQITTNILSNDPNTHFFASEYSTSANLVSFGGLTFGAGVNKLDKDNINRSIWCEFYYSTQ